MIVKAWHRLRALSAADRRLLLEAAARLMCASLGLRMFSLPTLRRLLGEASSPSGVTGPGCSTEDIHRVTWAVGAAARRLPVHATCLVEALAAHVMLRRRGCLCELRVGVLRTSGPQPFAAHAWVEHQGVVMLGQVENLSDYTVLSSPRGV